MAENNKENGLGWELIGRVLHRFYVRYQFHFGKLDLAFLEAVKKGAANWRILRYQHICNPEQFAYPIPRTSFVRPKTFEQHLRYYNDYCNVMKLEDLVRKLLNEETIDNKTVALTFDAGYMDTYFEAFPRLQNFGMPATLFLPTAFIGTNNLFWTEKIMAALLIMKDANYEFPILPQFDENFLKKLGQVEAGTNISLAKIAFTIDELKKSPANVRFEALNELGHIIEEVGGLPFTNTFLTWDQVKEISSAGFSIGVMGHGHKYFDETTADELRDDINLAVVALKELGITPINTVACPDGRFSRVSRKVLGELGIDSILAIGSYSKPNFESKNAAVFGRQDVFQNMSYCKEYLAYFLW